MLKAILLDFNGVIINDEAIHQHLFEEIIIGENLRPEESEYRQLCLGRSDRACLRDILFRRGRVVSEDYLTRLINAKAQAYQKKIQQLETLPIYPEIKEFLPKIQQQGLLIGLVSGALRQEIELVLERADIAQYFCAIVSGDDIQKSKPEPDSYLLAVERLDRQNPKIGLKPSNCLAIEDTMAGIEAAKRAGIQAIGISNTYPLHMLQRHADWAVDYLADIELERVEKALSLLTTS